MRNLRLQLLVSHLLLVLLMGLVMSGAIATFFRLGHSIDVVLTNNFQGALTAREMLQAIGSQETGMNLLLGGKVSEARVEISSSWPKFLAAFDRMAKASDPRQQQLVVEIRLASARYQSSVDDLLSLPPESIQAEAERRYVSTLGPALARLKERTQRILEINETEIDRANTNVKAEAQSAASGSLIVTAAALVLALLLATLVVRLALKPLARVAEQAEALGAGHLDRRLDLRRTDEVGQLASAFNTMADRLQEHRKTEERRLRRAERMADMALEFLYDPVVVTDAIGRIVFLNHAAEGLFGPSPAAPRTPIVEHVGDRRIVTAIERAIKEDAVSAGEDEATLIPISVGGTERAYRLRATPMKDQEGAILGCVAVLEDITHLKELDRLKTEFIGVASHELRTPVTSLLLASQLLRERSAGPLTPMQEQIVNAQQEDLERLERLLQELLDITKLEAGSSPPRFALVAPAELVRQAVDTIKANAAEKGVMLKHEIGKALKTVRADPGQIVRVLVNLADNAVRHTPSGGSVTLRAMAKDDHVTFEVEDTGEGIHPDYLSRIFDRFVQVPGTTQGGAGLGLSIAQTILKAHGSEMRVTSELQKGSKFQFTLGSEAPAAGDTST